MTTVLTINTFPGSPVPYLFNGTRSLYNDGDRLKRLASAIKAEDPDIVCFQELNCFASRDYLKSCFLDTHVLLHGNSVSWFGRMIWFVIHSFVFTSLMFTLKMLFPAILLTWWSLRKSTLDVYLNEDETGLAIMYRKSKFLIDERFTISKFKSQRGDWTNCMNPRAYARVKLYSLVAKKNICIFNVHLNALGSSEERAVQTSELLESCSKCDNIVLCGDFNDSADSSVIRQVISAGFIDSMAGVTPRNSWCSSNSLAAGWMRVADMCVDYIFHTQNLQSDQASLCLNRQPFVSDHFGVKARINTRNKL